VANSYDVGVSLCDEGAIHHCALALHHYGEAITSLFTNNKISAIIIFRKVVL